MAGNVINLRRERKRRARQDDASKAAENRTRFGRTSVEKLIDRREEQRRTSIWTATSLKAPIRTTAPHHRHSPVVRRWHARCLSDAQTG